VGVRNGATPLLLLSAARRLLRPQKLPTPPSPSGALQCAPDNHADPLVVGALTALRRSRDFAAQGDATTAALYQDTAQCRARAAALRREAARGWALRVE